MLQLSPPSLTLRHADGPFGAIVFLLKQKWPPCGLMSSKVKKDELLS